MVEQFVVELSNNCKKEINKWLKRFPAEAKQSAIIPALTIVQQEYKGMLSKALITAVAKYLAVAEILVYEVATFYKMYELEPVGKYTISVCTNVSCMLCDGYGIANYLKDKLGIDFGEVTQDGKFLLQETECLGACDGAPAMMINNKCYTALSTAKIDDILDNLE